ncbi:MAG TPA: helix-turn-helix domain-containing protein [Candidatus Wunengus sp. YC63]|uniref:helix-turn-helix domain-containing protein n=1 Tax=unclassified Candidatus Wunengus TaxID=3367695 RepID=UPI0040287733
MIDTGDSYQSQSDISEDVKQKLEWFDHYEKHGKNARLTCRYFGISPDTFYRWKRRYDPHNLSSLADDKKTRRPKNLREPTTPLYVVNRIEVLKGIHPAWSNGDILTQLKNEGVSISCSTIRRIMKRLNASGHSHKHTTASDVRNKRGKKAPRYDYDKPTGYGEYISLLKLWKG